jgi:hypothetical protein
MNSDENEAFEEITKQVVAEAAFESYVESTAQILRMLEVVVEMASRVAMTTKAYADAAGTTVGDTLYHDVFVNVWDKTVASMFEASRQYDSMQAIAEILEQRGNDDE